ncbi:MAG: pyridoxamine 5'-phosphate oxidase family protein [Anaerolineaceae bacterium]
MLVELSFEECEAILLRNRVGRIGIRDADGVYIVPLSYALRMGCIYAHCAPGHKLALIHLWPHVGFEVDEIQSAEKWQSVLARGRCEELLDEEEKFQARALLLGAFDGELAKVTSGHGHRTTLADATLLRIRLDNVTGRANNS